MGIFSHLIFTFEFPKQLFTLVFALRVRSSHFPHMTSSISNDVIFFHSALENVLIALNIKFNQNGSVRYRYIYVFVSTGGRFLNRKLTFKHTKYMFLE